MSEPPLSTPDGGGPELAKVPGSAALYAFAAADGGALFLLADPSSAPETLQLSELWSDSGPPAKPGWFVFPAAPGAAAALEPQLRSCLLTAATTGIAWARGDGTSAARVPIRQDGSGAPCAAADSTLPTPAGTLALSFAEGTPLRASPLAESPQAILASYPPALGPGATGPALVAVQLQGPNSGCLTFEALVGQPPAEQSGVTLMAVSIDPLRPFDPLRTYQMFTGRNFGFASAGNGWQLVDLEDRAE